MAPPLAYPKTADNTVKRYKDRASYDLYTVHSLINCSAVVHVSFNDPESPFPVILPMVGQMGSFEYPSADLDEPLDCYLHSYITSRMAKLARACPDGSKGIPVCISTAKVDGLILAINTSKHSYNFRSAILHGYAELVTDPAEKTYASNLVVDSMLPNRHKKSVPPTNADFASTQFLRVRVVDGSAKIKANGGAGVQPSKEDPEAQKRVWSGVIPVWEHCGEPVPAPINRVAEIPEEVSSLVARLNTDNEKLARSSV